MRPIRVGGHSLSSRFLKPGLILGASIVIAGGLFFYQGCQREPNLTAIADENTQALFAGDSKVLANHVLPEELSALGWNREQAAKFLELVIFPKLKGLTLLKITSKRLVGNGVKAIVDYRYRNVDGSEVESSLSTFAMDRGGGISLSSLLQQAWMKDYRSKHKVNEASEWRLRAVKNGVVSDYKALKEMGFRSFFDVERGRVHKSLEQAYQDAQSWLSAHPEQD